MRLSRLVVWALPAGMAACAAGNGNPWEGALGLSSLYGFGSTPFETAGDLPLAALRERASKVGTVTHEELYDADPPRIVGGEEDDAFHFLRFTIELERAGDSPADFLVDAMTGVPPWRSERAPKHRPFAEEQERLHLVVGDLVWGSTRGGFLWCTSRPNVYVRLAREPDGSPDGDGSDTRTITEVVAVYRPEWLAKSGHVPIADLKRALEADPEAAARCAPSIQELAAVEPGAAAGLRDLVVAGSSQELARMADMAHERFDAAADLSQRCAILADAARAHDAICAPGPWPTRSGKVIEAMRDEQTGDLERQAGTARTEAHRVTAGLLLAIRDEIAAIGPGSRASIDAAGLAAKLPRAQALDALPLGQRLREFADLQAALADDSPAAELQFAGLVRHELIDEFVDAAEAATAAGLHASACGRWFLVHTLLRGRMLDQALIEGPAAHLVLPARLAVARAPALASLGSVPRPTHDDALLRARAAARHVIVQLVPLTRSNLGRHEGRGPLAGTGAERAIALWPGDGAGQNGWHTDPAAETLELEVGDPHVTVARQPDRTVTARATVRQFRAGHNVGAVAEWTRELEALAQQIGAMDGSIASNRKAAVTPTAMHGFESMRYVRSEGRTSYYEVVKDTERLSSILGRLEALRDAEQLEEERERLVARYEELCGRRPLETPPGIVARVVDYPVQLQTWKIEVTASVRLHGTRTDYDFRGVCPLEDQRMRIAADPANGIEGRDDWTTEEAVRDAVSGIAWLRGIEDLACDALLEQRRAALAAGLEAAGRTTAEIEAELRWVDWLLRDPERTADAEVAAAARSQQALVEIARRAAQGTRGGAPATTLLRLYRDAAGADADSAPAAIHAEADRIGRFDPASAASLLRHHLASNPGDAVAWRRLAFHELVQNHYAAARAAFASEDEVRPSGAARHCARVMTYWDDLGAGRRSDISWQAVLRHVHELTPEDAVDVRRLEHEISEQHRYFNSLGFRSQDLLRELRP